MEKTINGQQINVNEEGYLQDYNEWCEPVAECIAREEGITLTERHWEVLQYLQNQHKAGVSLTIRRIGKSGVVTIKEFYGLFPGGPLKKATKIAGIPKPASCI